MRVYLLVIDTIKLHIIKVHFLIWQLYIYFYIRYTYFISLSSKNSAYIVSYITLRKSVELINNSVAEKIQLHYSSQANQKGTCEKKMVLLLEIVQLQSLIVLWGTGAWTDCAAESMVRFSLTELLNIFMFEYVWQTIWNRTHFSVS